MEKTLNNKIILYIGLGLLVIAILVRYAGMPALLWGPLFALAIVLKAGFLAGVMRSKDFRFSLWLRFVLVGVVLVFASMIFKYLYPVLWLRSILFYGAIACKVTGLVLMIVGRIKGKDF